MLLRLICLSLVFSVVVSAPAAAQETLPTRLALAEEVGEMYAAFYDEDDLNGSLGWRSLVRRYWFDLHDEETFARYFDVDIEANMARLLEDWRKAAPEYRPNLASRIARSVMADVRFLNENGQAETALDLLNAFETLPEAAVMLAVAGEEDRIETLRMGLAMEAGDQETLRALILELNAPSRSADRRVRLDQALLAAAAAGDEVWALGQALNRLPPDVEAALDTGDRETLTGFYALLAASDDPVMRARAEDFAIIAGRGYWRATVFRTYADAANVLGRPHWARRYAYQALRTLLLGELRNPLWFNEQLSLTLAESGACETAQQFEHLVALDHAVLELSNRQSREPQVMIVEGREITFPPHVFQERSWRLRVWEACEMTDPLIDAAIEHFEPMRRDRIERRGHGGSYSYDVANRLDALSPEARATVLRGIASRLDWRDFIPTVEEAGDDWLIEDRIFVTPLFMLVESLRTANRNVEADQALARLLAAADVGDAYLERRLNEAGEHRESFRPYFETEIGEFALEVRARAVPLLPE